MLRRRAKARVGTEGELRRQRLIDQRPSGEALDGDAEQHEVDVGIDRRSAAPHPLQDEGPQGFRVLAVGVERLDPGQVGLMGEAPAEGETPLGGVHVVLAQIRDGLDQRIVEGNPSLLNQVKDQGRGEDDLGEGGEVEPGVPRHGLALRLDLRQARPLNGALAIGRHDAENRARNMAGLNGRGGGREGLFDPVGRGHGNLTPRDAVRRRAWGGARPWWWEG
jgi:hypothetical protein